MPEGKVLYIKSVLDKGILRESSWKEKYLKSIQT
jgi:hypothetical protein